MITTNQISEAFSIEKYREVYENFRPLSRDLQARLSYIIKNLMWDTLEPDTKSVLFYAGYDFAVTETEQRRHNAFTPSLIVIMQDSAGKEYAHAVPIMLLEFPKDQFLQSVQALSEEEKERRVEIRAEISA